MSLTELTLKNLKPKEKRYMVRDDQGLYIEIHPTGRKSWKVRSMIDGKSKKFTLGEYPKMGLREARQKRDEMRDAKDIDQIPEKQIRTFQDVAKEWYETHIKGTCSEGHAVTVVSRLDRFLYPKLGDKPIREIKAPEILDLLRSLQNAGTIETAHRVKQIAGQVFRYAIAIGEGDRDITADLRGALKPNRHDHHGAAKTLKEVRAVVQAMSVYQGSTLVTGALWFSAYTFARPGEVRHAEWVEIDFETAEWRVPAEKMKARKVHIVPLAIQTVKILKEIKQLTGHGRYIFPSTRALRHCDTPMSENTITAALRRMGFEKNEMTAHGFRAMASTRLNELGWAPDVIERQLAHVEKSAVRAAYNHAEHLSERRRMMQTWADYLDSLLVK